MRGEKFLKKLLDGVAVEWKELGDVVKLEKGRQLNKELLSEHGLYPAYNGGVSHSGFTDTFNYTENKTIVSQGGASAGFVNFVESKFYANAHCYVVLPNTEAIANRYVYHLLKLNQERLTGKQHGAGIPALRTTEILEISVPIPCPENRKKSLEIQSEIVHILDTFTAIAAELQIELEARKKQYAYYRDQLLRFDEGGVEWRPLGEICEFKNGFAFKSNLFRDAGFPIVRITNISGSSVDLADVKYFDPSDYKENTSSYAIEDGDILIAMSGATTGKIGCFHGTKTAYLNQRVGKFIPNNNLLSSRYLYHFLLSKTGAIYLLAGGGAQPNLSSKNLMEKILVPIPYADTADKSINEQNKIAAILDNLDTLANSISEGLPREIELRQKQYEYYRDLLLNFLKPEEIE